jgi:hypothetical protein
LSIFTINTGFVASDASPGSPVSGAAGPTAAVVEGATVVVGFAEVDEVAAVDVVVGVLSPPPPHAAAVSRRATRRGIAREARMINLIRWAGIASLSQTCGR